METEDKLNMMKAAGFEVTHEPSGKQLRCAKVWKGHDLLDRLEFPEAAYDSAMNILFNFYMIGHFGADGRSKTTVLNQLFKQQNAKQNPYANQAQGLMHGYPPEQLGRVVPPEQYEAKYEATQYALGIKTSNSQLGK